MAMQAFSRSLPMLLYRTLDAVMPRFRSIFGKFGLTEQQWRVLRVLWEMDGAALSDLADLTRIPAPSLVGVVDRLAKSGLVERRRSETDRRVVFIHATDEGKKLEEKVRPAVVQAYGELQARIDAEAWEQLISGMEHIIAACEASDVELKAAKR